MTAHWQTANPLEDVIKWHVVEGERELFILGEAMGAGVAL